MTKKRLGRGLDSLLSSTSSATQTPVEVAKTPEIEPSQTVQATDNPGPQGIPIDQITPSPYQPRRHFAPEALAELATSITNQGLLQPIVVRPKTQGGYELIAGERRWRAAQQAGLTHIPAVLRSVSDRDASALALIENVQREDLSALEEAMGMARLRDEFELTQQQIADAVGKSRVAIANLLRLLNLGQTARGLLERGEIEMGHARALLGLEGVMQDRAAQQTASQRLSVRQTEALVKKLLNPAGNAKTKPGTAQDADVARLEQRIMDKIGAPVAIKPSAGGGGEMTIRYGDLDQLDGVLKHLGIESE